MAQIALAMEIVAANGGSLHVAQWLFEEYASNCLVDTGLLFKTAACPGHAVVLTWLTKNIRLWKRLDAQVLCVVVEKGHLDVLKWWLKHSNPKALTSLEVEFATGEGRLEMLQFMYERAVDPSQLCTIRATKNAGANGYLGIAQWLHEVCRLQVTPPAMKDSLNVAKYLYDHREGDECGVSLLVNEVGIQCAAESVSIAYLEWVLAFAHSSDGEDQQGDKFALTRVNAQPAEVVTMYNH